MYLICMTFRELVLLSSSGDRLPFYWEVFVILYFMKSDARQNETWDLLNPRLLH